MKKKMQRIRAFIFDWDGVFNNGHKTESGSSSFSEIDSMGTNLLRFSQYLLYQHNPPVAVISGENNHAAAFFAAREHFHALYHTRNKIEALQHFCTAYSLEPAEVAFFFDDVLDLAVASVCGLRILVTQQASAMTRRFVVRKMLADYCTATDGLQHAVREGSELLMTLNGNFNDVLTHRIGNSDEYQAYLRLRNATLLQQYSEKDLPQP